MNVIVIFNLLMHLSIVFLKKKNIHFFKTSIFFFLSETSIDSHNYFFFAVNLINKNILGIIFFLIRIYAIAFLESNNYTKQNFF